MNIHDIYYKEEEMSINLDTSIEKESMRMTPKERLRAAFRREECDRVPAYPMSCRNNATLIGMSGIEYSLNGKKMAQSYIEYYKMFKPQYRPDKMVVHSLDIRQINQGIPLSTEKGRRSHNTRDRRPWFIRAFVLSSFPEH